MQELLPFLTDSVDDEDEVLVAIASSLSKLVEHVGGPAHAQALLQPLESLLTVEEATVREAACASAKLVADALPQNVFQDKYATMIADLATKEWFTSRISAATLLAHAYPRLKPNQQQDFVRYLESLCKDDTPMVRRVAAQNLGPMVQAIVETNGRSSLEKQGTITTVIIPLYSSLASNDQPDSVRLQTAENCVAFGTVMSKFAPNFTESELGLVNTLLPLIVATIDDRSWRVRWTAASQFAKVMNAFDKIPNVMYSLIPAYEKLLQDPEAEVSW
jgi:serine/threonine-protein phosphatase 2A regulatory subunit A